LGQGHAAADVFHEPRSQGRHAEGLLCGARIAQGDASAIEELLGAGAALHDQDVAGVQLLPEGDGRGCGHRRFLCWGMFTICSYDWKVNLGTLGRTPARFAWRRGAAEVGYAHSSVTPPRKRGARATARRMLWAPAFAGESG